MATVERLVAFAVYRVLVPAGVLVGLQHLLRSRGRSPRKAWRDAAGLYLGLGVAFAAPYLFLFSPGALESPGSPVLAVPRAVILWPGLLLFVAGAALPVLPGPN